MWKRGGTFSIMQLLVLFIVKGIVVGRVLMSSPLDSSIRQLVIQELSQKYRCVAWIQQFLDKVLLSKNSIQVCACAWMCACVYRSMCPHALSTLINFLISYWRLCNWKSSWFHGTRLLVVWKQTNILLRNDNRE